MVEQLIYFVLITLYLFMLISFAVSFAIKPYMAKERVSLKEDEFDENIECLKDMGLFDDEEMDEITKVYYADLNEKKRKLEKFKCINTLNELKVLGYLNDESYDRKVKELNTMFEVYY